MIDQLSLLYNGPVFEVGFGEKIPFPSALWHVKVLVIVFMKLFWRFCVVDEIYCRLHTCLEIITMEWIIKSCAGKKLNGSFQLH